METIKNFRSLLLILPLLLFSCSSDNDDNNGNNGGGGGNTDHVTVKYAVNTASDIVTGVQFRAATGDYIEDTDIEIEWAESVVVPRPFNASIFVQFANPSSTQVPYEIIIYVDDVPVRTKQGIVTANAMHSDSAVYDIMPE